MKRFPFLGVCLLLPALALLVLTGCPGPKPVDPAPGTNGGDGKVAGPKDKLKGAAIGTVKGIVKLSGDAPKRDELDPIKKMTEPKEKAICMSGDFKTQLWIVGKDGGVANVVISLEPAAKDKVFD